MKGDIIDKLYSVEVSNMSYLPCSGCGEPVEINAGGQASWNRPDAKSNPSKISGSAICRHCEAGTGFEIIDNVTSFVAGKHSYGSIDPKVPEVAQAFFVEAEMCSRSAAPNAVAAMCRASIETILNERGFKGDDLKRQINLAAAKKALDQDEIALAHGSRLLANSAIHGGELLLVSHILGQAPS